MQAKALDIDDLDTGAISRFEDAFQGMEAYVVKNGIKIDAMNEIRGYVDSILRAQAETRTETVPLLPILEKAESPLDHAQLQAQGGLATLINLSVVSSLLIAQQTKRLVTQKFRKD